MRHSILEFLSSNARWLSAGALMTFMSSFGQTFFISIFAGEIQGEFSLSHGQWGAIYGAGTTLSAGLMIWAGGLADRFRAQTLGTIVLAGLALSCLMMAFNSFLWALPVIVLCLRFMGQGMMSHIAVVSMARWFVANRGKALATATLGFSLGEMTLPILFVFLLTQMDWHFLWVIAACLAFCAIPVLRFLLREERVPKSDTVEDRRSGMNGRHWTRAEALRHPLFWYLVPSMLGLPAFGTALFFHQVYFSELKGFSHLEFVSLMPVYTGVGILSLIASGIALDRLGAARLLPFYQIPLVLAFVVFGLGHGVSSLALGFALTAISSGAAATLMNAFWADAYGTAHIGSIKALIAAVMVLGSALGPFLTGFFIDAGWGLESQYLAVSAYFIFSSLVMFVAIRRSFEVGHKNPIEG